MRYDVVIANPPFGKREAVEYDGKKIPGLDPQITLNALSSMKDDAEPLSSSVEIWSMRTMVL